MPTNCHARPQAALFPPAAKAAQDFPHAGHLRHELDLANAHAVEKSRKQHHPSTLEVIDRVDIQTLLSVVAVAARTPRDRHEALEHVKSA